MPSAFEIIGSAWSFYKKQPVLNEIAFWLFFLPIAFIDASMSVFETLSGQQLSTNGLEALGATEVVLFVPAFIAVIFLVVWGQACALTVAKRIVASPAGRNRTSFAAVRKQGKKFITALFLTELLRGAITLLLMLLLIIPGVIYSVRTGFYDIMMIESGKVTYGRTYLHKSADFVKGYTGLVLWKIISVGCILFVPAMIFEMGIISVLMLIDERLQTLGIVLSDGIESFLTVFFIVCIVTVYAELKSLRGATK